MPRKELVSKIEYLSFRIWLAGFKLMPASLARRILIGLFLAVGYGLGIRKKVAMQQLGRVYPELKQSQKKQILKRLYRSMALTIQEVYLCSDEQLFSSSRITGKQYVEEALALGRGAILATAHFGNWEAARVLPKAGIPLSVITKTQRNKRFDAYTKAIRERCGVRTIDMSRGLRDIVHQLSEGRIIAILMDQNAGKNGLILDFLGYPASHWKGVAKLSLRYQIPIVPGFARREADDSLVFEFMPFILTKDLEDKEDNYPLVLQQVNAIIEQYIRRWPEQWFWVHKRWKHCYDMFS
ncbi:MAG TPA: lysophospholipid acyltransferase family protein [Candidatus Cloacimonadota bacterium]|nr:lysophospholipid acyltransferase family protein [Candidatus Cloacimonadota bacterium]